MFQIRGKEQNKHISNNKDLKEGKQGGREEVRGREKGRERKRDADCIRGGNPPETLDLIGRMQPCLHAFYVCFPHRPTHTLEQSDFLVSAAESADSDA